MYNAISTTTRLKSPKIFQRLNSKTEFALEMYKINNYYRNGADKETESHQCDITFWYFNSTNNNIKTIKHNLDYEYIKFVSMPSWC